MPPVARDACVFDHGPQRRVLYHWSDTQSLNLKYKVYILSRAATHILMLEYQSTLPWGPVCVVERKGLCPQAEKHCACCRMPIPGGVMKRSPVREEGVGAVDWCTCQNLPHTIRGVERRACQDYE